VVTSTATDPSETTSEMSECANLVEPGSIAFTSVRSGNRDIFLMNGDGTNPRRLTKNPAADYQPTLAPTQIVFVSNRDGNRELYSMNLSGHNVSRLTSNPAGDFEPSWMAPGP
jgi:Tol biopolymer transport system component